MRGRFLSISVVALGITSGCVSDARRECEGAFATSYTVSLAAGEGAAALCFEEDVMTDFHIPPAIPAGCTLDAVFASACSGATVLVFCPDGVDQRIEVVKNDDGTLDGTFRRFSETGEGSCVHDVIAVPSE